MSKKQLARFYKLFVSVCVKRSSRFRYCVHSLIMVMTSLTETTCKSFKLDLLEIYLE